MSRTKLRSSLQRWGCSRLDGKRSTTPNILEPRRLVSQRLAVCNLVTLSRLARIMIAVVALAGCASSNVVKVSSSTYQPVAVSHVEVLYKEPHRPYEVIALIKHEAGWIGSSEGEIEKARERAAEVGADALLISSAENDTFFDYAQAKGKAIKWK
jgi:hypothetical protein